MVESGKIPDLGAALVTDAAPEDVAASYRPLEEFLRHTPVAESILRDQAGSVLAVWLHAEGRWAVDWVRLATAHTPISDRTALDCAAARPIPLADVVAYADQLKLPRAPITHYREGRVHPVASGRTGLEFVAVLGFGDEAQVLPTRLTRAEDVKDELKQAITSVRDELRKLLTDAPDPFAGRLAGAVWQPHQVELSADFVAGLGIRDIAVACNVKRATVDMWRLRHSDFPDPFTTDPRPRWNLAPIADWCARTGREFHFDRLLASVGQEVDNEAVMSLPGRALAYTKLLSLAPSLLRSVGTDRETQVVAEVDRIHRALGHD